VATIRDVAKHAGVSPATVSRVVNGLVGYSNETRERVEDAVKSLSYETDYLARGLKTRQTSVIGLLAPWSPTPWPPTSCRAWRRKSRNAATP
jgi:DNA-binding LacI/PurR family transcriptional regulator